MQRRQPLCLSWRVRARRRSGTRGAETETSDAVDLLNQFGPRHLSRVVLEPSSCQSLQQPGDVRFGHWKRPGPGPAGRGPKVVEEGQDDTRMEQVVFDLVPSPGEAFSGVIGPCGLSRRQRAVVPILDRNRGVMRRTILEISANGTLPTFPAR